MPELGPVELRLVCYGNAGDENLLDANHPEMERKLGMFGQKAKNWNLAQPTENRTRLANLVQ